MSICRFDLPPPIAFRPPRSGEKVSTALLTKDMSTWTKEHPSIPTWALQPCPHYLAVQNPVITGSVRSTNTGLNS